jgi:excisionase family DNA binding protein
MAPVSKSDPLSPSAGEASSRRGSDPVLTIEDVAARLNVNRRLVRKLMDEGRLRFVRVGNVYRFREAWLEAFIDGGR